MTKKYLGIAIITTIVYEIVAYFSGIASFISSTGFKFITVFLFFLVGLLTFYFFKLNLKQILLESFLYWALIIFFDITISLIWQVSYSYKSSFDLWIRSLFQTGLLMYMYLLILIILTSIFGWFIGSKIFKER